MKTQQSAEKAQKPEDVRFWTFQSINRGLKQVLIPGKVNDAGFVIAQPVIANFGGDDGRRGLWKTKEKELAAIIRNKMRMKTVADFNITEITEDQTNGDPVIEAKEDASQPSS
ncbi:unnamed protein product [marine sediment metagenome]|uniref:Uncharacterized protein n=1 Tax=marine sediment metagenome TaxID=412755 RepID=X0T7C2_9ZZZZ